MSQTCCDRVRKCARPSSSRLIRQSLVHCCSLCCSRFRFQFIWWMKLATGISRSQFGNVLSEAANRSFFAVHRAGNDLSFFICRFDFVVPIARYERIWIWWLSLIDLVLFASSSKCLWLQSRRTSRKLRCKGILISRCSSIKFILLLNAVEFDRTCHPLLDSIRSRRKLLFLSLQLERVLLFPKYSNMSLERIRARSCESLIRRCYWDELKARHAS